MANLVRRQICNSVKKAGCYSILADETKDMSKQEQLSLVVRYIDFDTTEIKERFLTFVPAANLNAESLTKYILDSLSLYNLDPALIVSQGYDGASVMSGHCTGVQQRIRQVAPQAVYVHCHAHVLNLVLVDCVKNNPIASEFFCLNQSLYVFMSTSKAHTVFIEKQKELHPGQQTKELKKLSDTRWACRSLTLDVIESTFDSIVATLDCIGEDTDKAKAVEALGLLHQITTFKFVASLVIFQRIMSITKLLSDQLQSKTVDLACAVGLIVSTTTTLKDLRTDDIWDLTYKYICDVAALNNIDESLQRPHRRRQQPMRLENSVSFESVGYRESLSCSQSLKVNIYFPVIDLVVSELERRFSGSNLELMKSLDACNPVSSHFLDSSLLSSLASSYGIDNDPVPNECALAKRTLQRNHEKETVIEMFRQLLPLQAAFPTITKLFQISLTIAVSTAQCERSFSALKRIKTHLRTTMTHQRLADISLLSLEKDLSSGETFLEDTLQEFEGVDRNRSIILS